MNELIKINRNEKDRPTVLGRELHELLEIKTQYSKWFDRMCEYGFAENTDFVAISQKRLTAQGNETTYIDHQLTIDMAKEICMIQRSEIGRKCRQYFIDVEKQWNSPDAVIERALKIADSRIKELQRERDNAPINVQQKSQLTNEIDIKIIDLCNSGRLYMKIGREMRFALITELYKALGVDEKNEIKSIQFSEAVDFVRHFSPSKKLRCEMQAASKALVRK